MTTHNIAPNPDARFRRRKGINAYLPPPGHEPIPHRKHTVAPEPDDETEPPIKDALHIDIDPLTCSLSRFLESLVHSKTYTADEIAKMVNNAHKAEKRASGHDIDGRPFLSHTGQKI